MDQRSQFILKSATLSNVRAYLQTSNMITFSPRLNLISGINGSGKTTILEALIFALTDATPKEADRCWHNNTLDPRTPFKCGVALSMYDKASTSTFTFRRERLIKGSKERVVIQSIPAESEFESGTNLGLVQFCLFCDQNNAFWMFETPANLYAQINKMLDLERYAQLAAELSKNLDKEDKIQKQLGQAKAELQEIYAGRQNAIKAQHAGKEVMKLLIEFRKTYKQASDAFNEFLQVSGDFDPEFAEDQDFKQQIQAVQQQIDQLRNSVESLKIGEIQVLIKQLSAQKDQISKKFGNKQGEVKEIMVQIRDLFSNKKFITSQINQAVENINSICGQAEFEADDVDKLCLLCQDFGKLYQEQISELESKKSKLTADIKKLQMEIHRSVKDNEDAIQLRDNLIQQLPKVEQADQIKQKITQINQDKQMLNLQLQQQKTTQQQLRDDTQKLDKQQLSFVSQQKLLEKLDQSSIQSFKQAENEFRNQFSDVDFSQGVIFAVQQVNKMLKEFKIGFDKVKPCSFASFSSFRQAVDQIVGNQNTDYSSQISNVISIKSGIKNNVPVLKSLKTEFAQFIEKQNVEKESYIIIFNQFVEHLISGASDSKEIESLQNLLSFSHFYEQFFLTMNPIMEKSKINNFNEFIQVALKMVNDFSLIVNELKCVEVQQLRIENVEINANISKLNKCFQNLQFDQFEELYSSILQSIIHEMDVLKMSINSQNEKQTALASKINEQQSVSTTFDLQLSEIKNQLDQLKISSGSDYSQIKQRLQTVSQSLDSFSQTKSQKEGQINLIQQQLDQIMLNCVAVQDNKVVIDEELLTKLRNVFGFNLIQSINEKLSLHQADLKELSETESSNKLLTEKLMVQINLLSISQNNQQKKSKALELHSKFESKCGNIFQDQLTQLQKKADDFVQSSLKVDVSLHQSKLQKQFQEIQVFLTRLDEKIQAAQSSSKDQSATMKGAIQRYSDAQADLLVSKDRRIAFTTLKMAIQDYQMQIMKSVNVNLAELWERAYSESKSRGDISRISIEQNDANALELVAWSKDLLGQEQRRGVRGTVSSGQRIMMSILVRVAFARAFNSQLQVLCLDEPTNFLDQRNEDNLADMLAEFITHNQMQVIIITHNAAFMDKLRAQCSAVPAKSFSIQKKNGQSVIFEAKV